MLRKIMGMKMITDTTRATMLHDGVKKVTIEMALMAELRVMVMMLTVVVVMMLAVMAPHWIS